MEIRKPTLVYKRHTVKEPDKYGEIVELEGIDMKAFRLNPAIIYGTLETCVGRAVALEVKDDGLWLMKTEIRDFAIAQAFERGDIVPVLCFRTIEHDEALGVPIHTKTELLAVMLVPKDKAVQ